MMKSMRMAWAGHVARMVNMRNAYKILDRKTEPFGIPWRRWEDNIERDVGEVERKVVYCIIWLMIFCEHGNEPSGSIKGGYFLTICVTLLHWVRLWNEDPLFPGHERKPCAVSIRV
jgi:hypothetical protein